MAALNRAERAARIVTDAGGKVVGKTRLQKIAFLLEACGVGDGFVFQYKHYGPYSEELASAATIAVAFGMMKEEEKQATWGGSYSIFTSGVTGSKSAIREKIATECAAVDAVELELAATALLLAKEGMTSPWGETAYRKPEKAAGGRLDRAKAFYAKLRGAVPDVHLPAIGT